MRIYVFLILAFTMFPMAVSARGARSSTAKQSALVVYCYDSFSSEWGPGPAIARSFTESTGYPVIFEAPGDAITVFNQLILEKNSPRADVVVGMDNGLLQRVLDEEILVPYKSPKLSAIPDELVFDETNHLIPYDYGHFAIIRDTAASIPTPASLENLTKAVYKDQLILMDPRTSTPGIGFLLWTVATYEDGWQDYWKRLSPSILTITDSWSAGYALFTAGEAALVLSYGTSPVYHIEYEGTDRYTALEFEGGHVRQIEGMGIVRGTRNRAAAETFIDFMLEESSQSTLATTNIMLPVIPDTRLPASFSAALRPRKEMNLGSLSRTRDIDALIDEWVAVASGKW